MSEIHSSIVEPCPNEAPSAVRAGPRLILSCDLLRGAREVQIQHGTETYRLRLTKAGKLILNK